MTRGVCWLACFCYVWPVAYGARLGRCGWCLAQPSRLVDAPLSGKAGPV